MCTGPSTFPLLSDPLYNNDLTGEKCIAILQKYGHGPSLCEEMRKALNSYCCHLKLKFKYIGYMDLQIMDDLIDFDD